MNKGKLRKLTVPAIYTLAICVFATSMYLLQRIFNNKTLSNDMKYVDEYIVTDQSYVPVVNQPITILKPYLNEIVTTSKSFYDYTGENKDQENAIIFYEGTYMQNSGIDYTYTEAFDIISILDGTVIEVTDNELLGKTIKIRHNNDLISIYQCLKETKVNVNDNVLRGQIIGISGTSQLYSKDNNLHFELYYQGKSVNPELYYNKSIDEL